MLGRSDLGFEGLLSIGVPKREAWQEIRERFERPGLIPIIADLERTEQGREVLAYARRRWAAYGLPAPWEPAAALPPEQGAPDDDGGR